MKDSVIRLCAVSLLLACLATVPVLGQASGPRILSVLYFANTAKVGEYDWLSKGLADMLVSDFGAAGDGSLAIVEREELEKVIKEQELGLSGLIDPATAPEIGRLLGANLLVYGSFLVVGDKLRLDGKVVRSDSGAIACVGSAEGPANSVLDLERILFVRLAAGLGLSIGLDMMSPPVQAFSLEAVRAYYRGIDRLDAGDYAAALAWFSESTRLDPLFLKPGKGIEDSYKYLKDFKRQRYRREMNALVADIDSLSARVRATRFYSFADALANPGIAGLKDAQAVGAAYQARPAIFAGDTPVQATWYLQNLFSELGGKALEFFDDGAMKTRCDDQILLWAAAAEKAYPRDPFIPEVIFKTLFVFQDRNDWAMVMSLCERLMSDYPDYRMMWAVEDAYDRALKKLGKLE